MNDEKPQDEKKEPDYSFLPEELIEQAKQLNQKIGNLDQKMESLTKPKP